MNWCKETTPITNPIQRWSDKNILERRGLPVNPCAYLRQRPLLEHCPIKGQRQTKIIFQTELVPTVNVQQQLLSNISVQRTNHCKLELKQEKKSCPKLYHLYFYTFKSHSTMQKTFVKHKNFWFAQISLSNTDSSLWDEDVHVAAVMWLDGRLADLLWCSIYDMLVRAHP